jgi:hypothetical protein
VLKDDVTDAFLHTTASSMMSFRTILQLQDKECLAMEDLAADQRSIMEDQQGDV